MTAVYVDSVFLLNAVMDYLLCLVTARLAGIPLRRKRYLFSALAGGVYAVMVFLPGCEFLSAAPVKLAAGVLIALVAYGGEEAFLRLTLLLFAISCAMAGCVLALGLVTGYAVPVINGIFYTDMNGIVLLISATAIYLVLTVVFRAAAKHSVAGELLPVQISVGGKIAELAALWDTGNGLRDLVDGRPVLILAPGVLDMVLPRNIMPLLTPKRLQFPTELMAPLMAAAPELRPRLMPYRAVGTTGGLLVSIELEWADINGERVDRLRAALSPTSLGVGYTALWGGKVRKEDGYHERTFPTAAGTVRADPARPLYWR